MESSINKHRKPLSFLAGFLLGILVFSVALPAGISAYMLIIGASAFVFVSSLTSFVVLSLHNWPSINESNFSIYDFQRLNIGIGTGIFILGLLLASIQKLVSQYSVAPALAAFISVITLGIYLTLSSVVIRFVVRAR